MRKRTTKSLKKIAELEMTETQKKKFSGAFGSAVGMIMCVAFLLCFFTPAYEVYMDGKKVAVVADKQDFEESYEVVNQTIESALGKGYILTKMPTYVVTVAPKSDISNRQEMSKKIISLSDAVKWYLYEKPAEETVEVFANVTLSNNITEEESYVVLKESSVGTGVFLQPHVGTITSRFGPRWGTRHSGIDIAGKMDSPIKAADSGIVKTAEYQENGYGNIVILDHGNGTETWYAHLNSIDVSAGDVIQKGDVVGKLGETGKTTGPHLHFEVRKEGRAVDPSDYIDSLK